MDCERIGFSGHAMARMFERGFSAQDVAEAMRSGKTIRDYPDDKPYPSRLILGFVGSRPLHAIVARQARKCIVVTAYEPDPALWDATYSKRINS